MTSKYKIITHKMSYSASSLSFDDWNSNSDNDFDLYSPKISLVEEDKINTSFPFNQPESKKTEIKIVLELFNVTKKKRKEKGDNIRKKIKTFFHKYLRKVINIKLERAGSKYFFESFPQIFMTDITLKTNFEVMELTYEQLINYTYNQEVNNDKSNLTKDYIHKRKATTDKKYKRNIQVLEYLNRNIKISEESGWQIIKSMKYKDLLQAYFNSNEFLLSIEELSKKESNDYINSYNYFSSNYVNFFLGYHPKNKKDNQKEIHSFYQSRKKENILKDTPNSKNGSEGNNNIPGLMIPLPSNFPQAIFETMEGDKYFFDSSDFSKIDDYDLINGNSLFNEVNNLFEKKIILY